MSPVKILDIDGAIRKMALISILKSFNTIATLSFLIICSTQVQAFEAKVIRILDGDTIEVLKDGSPLRVRLHGIDCPERKQDFGSVARQFTGAKTFGRVVEIVPTNTDKYGRTVAKIYVEEQYLNLMLVAEGLAWWFKKYAPNDYDLAQAEQPARSLKKGLWSQPNPIPPWNFRRHRASSSDKPMQPQSTQAPDLSPKLFIVARTGHRFSINRIASIATARIALKNSTASKRLRRMETDHANLPICHACISINFFK